MFGYLPRYGPLEGVLGDTQGLGMMETPVEKAMERLRWKPGLYNVDP